MNRLFVLLAFTTSSIYSERVIYDCTPVSVQLTSVSPTASTNLACPLFDGSLGTLTSAGLPLDTTGYVSPAGFETVQNTTSTPWNPINNLTLNTDYWFGPFPGLTQTTHGAWPLWATSGPTLLPGQTLTYTTALSFSGTSLVETSNFAAFLTSSGASALIVPFSISTRPYSGLDPGINLVDFSFNFGIAHPQVVYDYTPAAAASSPEPGTFSLVAISAVLTFLMLRLAKAQPARGTFRHGTPCMYAVFPDGKANVPEPKH